MSNLLPILCLAALSTSCQEYREKLSRIENPLIIYPGEVTHSNVGTVDGRSRRVSKGTEGAVTFGPYTDAIHNGVNMVSFQLEVSEKTSAPVARIDVTQNATLLSSKVLKGTDFHRAHEAQEFRLRFTNDDYNNIEFVVYALGGADVKHNRTVVRPIPHENVNTWGGTYAWDFQDLGRNTPNPFWEMTQTGLSLLLDYTLELPELPHSNLTKFRELKKEQGADGVRFMLNVTITDIVRPCCINTTRDPKSVTEQEIKDFYRERRARLGDDKLQDIAAIYIVDEPELSGNDRGYTGFHPWQVDAAVRAAAIEFPAIPTFIAYFNDHSHASPGLDYRGMEYYHREADDPNNRRGRYHEVQKTLNGSKIVIIPRSFPGPPHFELMNDRDQARLNNDILNDIATRDDVVGSIWFIWGNNHGDPNQPGLAQMPETRKAVLNWATRTRLGL